MRMTVAIILTILMLSCQDSSFEGGKENVEAQKPEPQTDNLTPESPTDPLVTNVDIVAADTSIDTEKLFVECLVGAVEGVYPMKALLYQLPVDTALLPDFATMTPVKKVCLRQLDISNRDFSQGFPGVENLFEWFALDIRFKLLVPEDGSYTFSINSDDGSKVYIDGALLINNDGQHGQEELSGIASLSAGLHDVKVEYFQGPRFKIALELFWQSDKIAKSFIPPENIKISNDPVFDQIPN